MPLNKNYTKMLGTDAPSTIDNTNSTQIDEIEADMTTIESHVDDTSSNPHSVTATQVGLGSANNTADADKPVSTATQTALDLKADASAVPDELTDLDTTVTGAQLNSLKTKVDGIETGADVTDATNVNAAGAVMESDLISTSAGVGDASKPVKLDAAGHIDASMVNDGDIDHGAMSGLGDDDHTQYSLADGTRDFTNKVSYDVAKTFTGDNELVTKKYVDDEITGAGGYNDEAAQDAVGGILTDTAEIDFTYDDGVGSITADIKAGSIDETKLDTSTNASLDLADSALQSSDIGSTVQAQDAHLDSLAGLTPGVEGRMITSDGLGTYQMSTVSGVRSYLNVEDGADVTDATNVNAAGATMNTDTDVSGNSYVLDEDDMTSDSNTKLATQQSIKAYSDAKDNGWIPYASTMPTVTTSDSNGVDTISFAGVDLTGDYNVGNFIKIVHSTAGTLYFKLKEISFSTNTAIEIVGETSVPATGTITAISFSRSASPQGVTPWDGLFKFSAYLGTNQTGIGTSTFTKINIDTEKYDDNNDFDTANKRYVSPITGTADFSGAVYLTAGSSVTSLMCALYVNGTLRKRGLWHDTNSTFRSSTAPFNGINLNRGDYVELYTYIGGTSNTISAGDINTYFTGNFIGL